MHFGQSSFRSELSRKTIAVLISTSIVLSPASPAFAAFGDGTPTIQNPDAFSSDATAPKVDNQSGAFSQRIALDIPPGRNGIQPDLALQYNSQSTSDGIVGYGWSLSLPYVQRLNKTGSQNLYVSSSLYYTSSLDGELANVGTTTTAATTSPSIIDTLPLTLHQTASLVTSDSFAYTVPSAGTNKLLVAVIALGGDKSASLSATQNGIPLTCQYLGLGTRTYHHLCYLANPSSGTFSMSWSGSSVFQYTVMTLKDAAQSNPIDATALGTLTTSGSSVGQNLTTTQGGDLLIDHVVGAQNITHSFGAGQTQTYMGSFGDQFGKDSQSYKVAAATAGTESMSRSFSPNDNNDDILIVAIKKATAGAALVAGSYKARVEDGSSLAYTFANNSWTAYDKKGNRYLFGSDDAGRQYDTTTGTSTKTFKWMLQEIRDPNNNYVKFTYAKDSNEIYPSQVLYTGSGSTDGIFKVTFATSTRTDVRTSYASTFAVTTNYRVSEITALINGATVRKYLLGYGVGVNGKRSLLKSLQQQGYDENNTLTTLPAMTFAYASSSAQVYAPSNVDHKISGQGWAVADTNGNGINDLANFYTFSGTNNEQMYLDQSTAVDNAFSPIEYWTYNVSSPLERGVRYFDVNADGRADIVRGWQNVVVGQQQIIQKIYLNGYASSTGYQWPITIGTTSTNTIPVFAQQNTSFTLTGGVFGDVNADGLPDYESSLPGWVSPIAYLGNGAGWDSTTANFVPAKDFPTTAPTQIASQLVDVNGDGLDDWLYSDATKTYALLNTGTGWQSTPASQWTIATSTMYDDPNSAEYRDRGIRFFDINGDGLPDFIRSYSLTTNCSDPSQGEKGNYTAVLLNTGSGWATSTTYTLPSYIYSIYTTESCSWVGPSFNEYGNWNGNGQQNQDVLTTVTTSKGGASSVTYAMTPSSGAHPELGYSLLVVTALGLYDGRGNAATTTYSYSGGKQYSSLGVRDRKFAGFADSTVTAPDSVTKTYFGQGMSTSTSLGEQAGGYAQINRPFRKDVFDLGGNLVQKSFFRWDASYNGNSIFAGLGRQVQQDYAVDTTHRDSATDYLYSSSTNDLIKKTEFGEVTGNSDGTFTDTGSDKRTTNIVYAASSSGFTVPIQKTVLDNSAATTSDQKLYYDGLAFGSLTKGNNTREEAWISGVTYASSTKTFNSYGLVSSSTDRRGKLTSNIFDAKNLYLASSTNPLSQQSQFTYDYSVGKTKQTTDPNSRITRTLYDGIGRIREIGQSDVTTPSTLATTSVFQYTDSATPPSTVRRTDYLTSTTTIDTYSYFDGLGRLIQERKSSQYANVFSTSDRAYNSTGLLGSQSFPYFSSGTSFSTPTTNASLLNSFTYDPLKRPLTTANAVGTTTTAYSKWTTTVTNPNTNIKDFVRDAFGNLASVIEHAATNQTTAYTYDTQNNSTGLSDALGNIRAFTYDGLSRRLTAQDLHASGDGTFGTWSYGYDDANNMTTQTDPKSQVVNRTYDSLNRLLTEDYTGLAGTEAANIYDTCTKGIGYLCTASSTAASSTTAYDALGRAATTTISVFGIPYAMGYAYDFLGNITTLTYPDSSQIRYIYNAAGSPSRVVRKASGASTYSDFVSNLDYGPHGQVVNTLFGNGASTTKGFNANALYRLSTLQTLGAGSTYLQNFSYTYDPFGNITQIANTASTSAAATTAYSYDQLNRLLRASTTVATSTPYQQNFTYDALGNILTLTSGATSSGATPSVLDTLPLAVHQNATWVTSDSFTYTVPSGGTNKLLIAYGVLGGDRSASIAATQNGASLTCKWIGVGTRAYHFICYLPNPSTGTFQLSWSGAINYEYTVLTLKDTAQTNPIDALNLNTLLTSGSSLTTSTTTSQGSDLILDILIGAIDTTHTFGANQSQTYMGTNGDVFGKTSMSTRVASSSAGSEPMSRSFAPNDNNDDLAIYGLKAVSAVLSGATTTTYVYAGTGYANPDAVTSIGNGLSTTTYSYDNNGNLTQSGATNYLIDYLNRITSIGLGGSTSTFGYDAFGFRAFQAATTSTTTYVGKFFSIASTTLSGAGWATTTSYIWLGDTLLGTIEQQFKSGGATGTAKTRYVHTDHLGSTNVVTDENAVIVQTIDYFPFGATRVSSATSTNQQRKYIGQYYDQNTNLQYLNARYYSAERGQFTSQDPVFWSRRQNIYNPQTLNTYSYAENSPINRSDPTGLLSKDSPKNISANVLKGLVQSLQNILTTLTTIQGIRGIGTTVSNPGSSGFTSGRSFVSAAKTSYADLTSGDDARQESAISNEILLAISLLGAKGASSFLGAEANATQLAVRAKEINGVLDPIAQSMRTTAVLRTSSGDIVASGGRDLSKAQIAALRSGETPATPVPGAHAEVTALMQASNSGSTPQFLGTSRPMCAECQAFIQSTGGTVIDNFTARW